MSANVELMPATPLWRLQRDGHVVQCIGDRRPRGLEARFLCDGKMLSSYQFSRTDELLAWARDKRTEMEARGWTPMEDFSDLLQGIAAGGRRRGKGVVMSEAKRFVKASGAGKVLVVDDMEGNVRLLTRLLSAEGYAVVTAHDGEEAAQAVGREHPDVVLMDVRMPKRDGFEVCRQLKRDPATRLTPVVLITALSERTDRLRAIEAGADDFVRRPIDPEEIKARVRSLVQLKRYTDDLDSAESVIISLVMTVEARDEYTNGHCQRLAAYAPAVGQRLNLPGDDLDALNRGGYLHDIGKVAIPDTILLKRGCLTRAEYETMKRHPVIGDHLCGSLRLLRHVRPIVRHHHERLDGSGYPDGLRGDAIPLLAQIMGIVDVYDALTTTRPYKPALSPEAACDELIKEADRGWRRRDLVDAFIAVGQDRQLFPRNRES